MRFAVRIFGNAVGPKSLLCENVKGIEEFPFGVMVLGRHFRNGRRKRNRGRVVAGTEFFRDSEFLPINLPG